MKRLLLSGKLKEIQAVINLDNTHHKKVKEKAGKVLTIRGESGILSKLFRTAAQNWKELEVRPVVAQEKHLTARVKSDIILRLFGRRKPSGEPEA
mgnify:FL=1